MDFKLVQIEEIRATGAFYAKIQQNGKIVGDVENDGRGGANYQHFINRTVEAEYIAAATALFDGALEDDYTNFLLSLADISRKRSIVAIKSVEEFAREGAYYVTKATTVAQIKAHATSQGMLVWDKKAYAFV